MRLSIVMEVGLVLSGPLSSILEIFNLPITYISLLSFKRCFSLKGYLPAQMRQSLKISFNWQFSHQRHVKLGVLLKSPASPRCA